MLAQLSAQQIRNFPITFVLAKGRSGTTLLQTMLDANKAIVAPFESRFVIHYKNRYGGLKKWSSERKKNFVKDIQKEQKISLFWDVDFEGLLSKLLLLPEKISYGDACKCVYLSSRTFFDKEHPQIIIDKNPIHAITWPLIEEVFPEANYIHIVRDYRATVLSTKKLQPRKGTKELGFRWLLSNIEIEKLKAKNATKFHFLNYEALLKNPEQELEKICHFLKVEYCDNMIKFHEKIASSVSRFTNSGKTEKERELRNLGLEMVHKNLTRPIDASFVDKWKKNISEEDLITLDAICGRYAQRYGYEAEKDIYEIPSLPFKIKLFRNKLRLYYSLPINIRELKSKPNLVFVEAHAK